LSFNIVGTQ